MCEETKEQVLEETEETTETAEPAAEAAVEPELTEVEQLKQQLSEEQNKYLRLAAEYDNYRKRSLKEKDHIYSDGVGDTLTKFLPIYDNLERALQQETADEAYKKGVEMIMTAMQETLGKCGVTVFGEKGEAFDPEMHNAVMHIEDESLGENVIADVFQKGFRIGEKVVRFAMVRVAN